MLRPGKSSGPLAPRLIRGRHALRCTRERILDRAVGDQEVLVQWGTFATYS